MNNKLNFVANYSKDAWAATISALKIDKGILFQIFTSASILFIFALDSIVGGTENSRSAPVCAGLKDFGKMSKLVCQLV